MKKITALILSLCALASHAQTNTNLGAGAGNAGVGNTSVGNLAGDVVTGTDNSFYGRNTGQSTTSGNYNSFFGAFSGNLTTSGGSNTFLGYTAGYSVTTGSNNTFIGRASGYATTASDNTFIGYYAGRLNTTGHSNTIVGKEAFFTNSSGISNTAVGFRALYNSSGGAANTALGYSSQLNNTTGSQNVSVGDHSLQNNTTGIWNIGVGSYALIGNQTGHGNIAIGRESGPTSTNLTNTVALGTETITTASNQVRIGDSGISSIGGFEDWTDFSDKRFKIEINDDVAGLAFINQLKPVSYFLDRKGINHFLGIQDSLVEHSVNLEKPRRYTGFIAQDVEQLVNDGKFVFGGVDAAKNEKDLYGLRYGQFVVPLVKAVQDLSAQTQELVTKIENQQKLIELLLAKDDSQTTLGEANSTGAVLYPNNPNPFSVDTEIKMKLPETVNHAALSIYSIGGLQLKSVPVQERGEVSIKISANELNSGIYIYSLVIDGKVIDSQRMILTK